MNAGSAPEDPTALKIALSLRARVHLVITAQQVTSLL